MISGKNLLCRCCSLVHKSVGEWSGGCVLYIVWRGSKCTTVASDDAVWSFFYFEFQKNLTKTQKKIKNFVYCSLHAYMSCVQYNVPSLVDEWYQYPFRPQILLLLLLLLTIIFLLAIFYCPLLPPLLTYYANHSHSRTVALLTIDHSLNSIHQHLLFFHI